MAFLSLYALVNDYSIAKSAIIEIMITSIISIN